MVLFCELANLYRQIQRVREVDDENAEKQSDEERETEMGYEPRHPADYKLMDKNYVNCRGGRPEQREKRAYYALNIAGLFGIVPQLYLHALDKNYARDVFERG